MAHRSLSDPAARLTPREYECLSLVSQGFQSKEIAELTGKAPKTIDKHIENACRKLGVPNRRQAARLHVSQERIRTDAVEAPFPMASPLVGAPDGVTKGGADVANTRTPPLPDLGRGRSDLRRTGDDERAEGSGASAVVDDAIDGAGSFTARLDARDLLHRARSPLRERSLAEETGRENPTPLKRMMSILVIAATASVLLAALLGGGVQLQLAVQAVDGLLSDR